MTTRSDARQLLRLEDISAVTGVPVNTLRSWRAKGRGEGPPMFTLGRRVVAYADEVDEWVAKHRRAAS